MNPGDSLQGLVGSDTLFCERKIHLVSARPTAFAHSESTVEIRQLVSAQKFYLSDRTVIQVWDTKWQSFC